MTPSVPLPAWRDDRIGRIPAAISGKPRAVREVDVFIDHEEVLVEAAQPLEQLAPDREGGAAGAKHLARVHKPCGMRAVAVLERAAGAQVAVAGAVDDVRTIEKDDPRGDERTVRRLGRSQRGRRASQSGAGIGVVVQEREPLAASHARAGVVAGGEPEVAAVVDDPHGRKPAGDAARSIRRSRRCRRAGSRTAARQPAPRAPSRHGSSHARPL